MYMSIHVYMYIHVHMSIHLHMCIHVHVCVHVHVCIHVHVHICVYMYMCVYIYIYICLFNYIIDSFQYENCLKKFQNFHNTEILLYLARAYYKTGRLNDCKRTLLKVRIYEFNYEQYINQLLCIHFSPNTYIYSVLCKP